MNWQYIAGFIDGEGTIFIKNNRFRITVVQTNKEVLEAIKEFCKRGNIVEITKRKAHWKDSWLYFISNKQDIYDFLIKIAPFLIVKRDRANYAIDYLKDELLRLKEKKQIAEERKNKARLLRKKGWSYRKIGKKFNTDWGYIRRLILS